MSMVGIILRNNGDAVERMKDKEIITMSEKMKVQKLE